MGVYRAAIVTENGQNLIAQALANEKPLIFTSAKTSSYSYPVGTDVPALTGLQDVVQSVLPFDSKVLGGNVAQVSVRFDNDGVDQTYRIETIGLYAKIEGGAEILFSVTQATTPDEMPVQSDISPSAYIYNIQHTVQNASQITLTVNPAGTATVQDIMDIETPEFDDSGTVEGISSFPSFLETMKSKMNFFQFFRNLKAGLQFVLHAGQIVNNCVTDNAGLPLSAAQGKALMDKYTQLYSEVGTVSDNLSKAISCSDLFADYSAPTFVEWNGNTLNTPFKAGFTDCQEGFAFCYGNWNNYMTVIAFAKNSNKMWAWSKAVNAWIEYVTKSDLEPVRSKQINRYVSAENNTDTVLSSYENKEGNFILQFTSNNTTGAIPTLTGSRLFIIEHFMVGNNSDSAIERAYSTKGKLIAWRFKQWWDKTWTAWENS